MIPQLGRPTPAFGFRSTRIRTPDNSLVTIPSSAVVNTTVETSVSEPSVANDLVKDAGVEFAFPTRTLQIANTTEKGTPRPTPDGSVVGFFRRT
jgi:hypothetical protein